MGNWKFASDTNKNIGSSTKSSGGDPRGEGANWGYTPPKKTPKAPVYKDDPRGNEGNTHTNYLTPAPKAPAPKAPTPVYKDDNPWSNDAMDSTPIAVTPVYPNTAPPSQGLGIDNTPPAPILKPKVLPEIKYGSNQPVPNDNYMQDWADSLESGIQDQFTDSEKQISSNTNDIKTNQNSINTNQDTTGEQIDGVQSNVDKVQSQANITNEDLMLLDALQKKLDLKVVDADNQIVDVQKDLIKNNEQQISGQKADLLERNAQEAATQKALEEIDFQFADQYNTMTENEESIALSTEELENIVLDMDNLGVNLTNINAEAEVAIEKDKYDQKYWANRLKELERSGVNAQEILAQEMNVLKDKAYSGDQVITAEEQSIAIESLRAMASQNGVVDANPNAPHGYIMEMTLNNIDQWVEDGKATVVTTVSGPLDENTERVYTFENGDILTRRTTVPVITDADGNEYRFGPDVEELFMNGVEMGSLKDEVTTIPKDGEANHVDSRVKVGDDTNPNSPANRPDGGNQNNNGSQGQGEGNSNETPVASTDPVVGEDIPLPDDFTEPDGDGAYGQDGQAFTLDGVTFWKRIKDRNGRWTYTRLDSYQDNGTDSRRQSWGNNVQNF